GGDAEQAGGVDTSPDQVRDFVALGYDRFLGRHRLMALVWDTGKHEFTGRSLPRARCDGPQSSTAYRFDQRISFFQCKDIEGTLLDTRGGSDIIHLNPDYFTPSLGERTWGVARGDVQAGATAFRRIEVRGGADRDMIYGSDYADLLLGQDGSDIIVGRKGDDLIVGGNGNDIVYGDTWTTSPNAVKSISVGTPDDASAQIATAT